MMAYPGRLKAGRSSQKIANDLLRAVEPASSLRERRYVSDAWLISELVGGTIWFLMTAVID